jgi:hypothetical protein
MNLSCSTAMLIIRLRLLVSYASDPLPNFQTDRAHDSRPRAAFHHLMPSHRILYVGMDYALLKFLNDALPDCLIVRCSDSHLANLFLKSNLKYALLLFHADKEGAKVERLARSLEHRKQTPVEVIKKPYDFGGLLVTIRRLLDS